MRVQDIAGQRFGKWLVVGPAESMKKKRMWLCRCECGTEKAVYHGHLVNGKSNGCRCAVRKHGMKGSPEHMTWVAMRTRCRNPHHPAYHRYGGRGIRVCERWLEFSAFYEDMGLRPEGCTLDRIDVNGNYEPGNCRWSTSQEQQNNASFNRHVDVDGETLTIAQLARKLGIHYATLYSRLKRTGAI